MICMVLAVLALMKSLFTMEIDKITFNGVEYAITDKQAQQIAALLSTRVDSMETATARLNKDILEIRAEHQQLKDEVNSNLSWKNLG